MMSYANYLYIAIRAAVDAGKSIMDIYNDPESDFGIERKADNSPLTKADKAAHLWRPGLRRRDSLLAKNPGKKQPGLRPWTRGPAAVRFR